MQQLTADVAIIGAGTAGLEAYRVAKENGLKPILIEKGPIGTTSIRTGCVPTQILQELSKSLNKVNVPSCITHYGRTPEALITFENLMQNLRNQKRGFIEDFVKNMYTIPENERVVGEAVFKDPKNIEIKEKGITITASTFIVATGSVPYVPAEFLSIKDRLLTTDNFFELEQLPKSVAIVGSGSVGLEFGQILSSLGVKVALFGRNALWNFTDQKVATEALDALRAHTFITMNSSLTDFELSDEALALYYLDESTHECLLNVEFLLCATGRMPYLAGLNLEAAGVEIGADGLPVIDRKTMQTNVPHIFLAGDVCEYQGTLQKAVMQGRTAGYNASCLVMKKPLCENDQPAMQILFTKPQLGIVGRTLSEVNEMARKGEKYIIGEGLVKNNLKAQIENSRSGLIHTYFSQKNGLLLGAEVCCPDAAAICQFLAAAIESKKGLKELVDMTFYHPSTFEVLSESFQDAVHKYRLLVKQQVK